MSKTSSDNAAESKSSPPECADEDKRDNANVAEQSDYYYDDATGYELYEDDEDEESEN